jgi:serine/threonine protein phosphatase PrpC
MYRVNGILAVSRAFGDTQFKASVVSKDNSKNNDLVIEDPEIYSETVTPMTEFAIIATDGLWYVNRYYLNLPRIS